jgi:hypothetical protein
MGLPEQDPPPCRTSNGGSGLGAKNGRRDLRAVDGNDGLRVFIVALPFENHEGLACLLAQ